MNPSMAGLTTVDFGSLFTLFCWRKGESPACFNVQSLSELGQNGNWDLCIIVAHRPLNRISEDICQQYGISDEFWSGIDHKPTHDFGVRRLSDSTCTTWIHFLCQYPTVEISSGTEWLRSSIILSSKPSSTSNSNQVTLILFQPLSSFYHVIDQLYRTKDAWEDALIDPYHLVNATFKAWYEEVDKDAWTVLNMAREEETTVFEQSSFTGPSESGPLEISYSRIHHRAKDAIHLVEALDAALLFIECAINEHTDMKSNANSNWKTEHDKLLHRRETFRSTRLRLSSIDQRLKNVINLAFNIGTLRDSQIMREDSFIMKTLAVVALVFLPVGTIAAMFGSQFFGTRDTELPDGSIQSSTYVTPQFWILWAISIPATLFLLLGGFYWIKKGRAQPRNKSLV